MTGPVLVVVLLATYRISLLVTHDTLTERPVKAAQAWLQRRKHPDARDAANPLVHEDVLLQRASDPHLLVKLTDCPWCVSFWIGAAVAGTGWLWGDRWWWFVPAAALAASALTGVLTDLSHPEGRTDDVPS
jgi:hypothetical protein